MRTLGRAAVLAVDAPSALDALVAVGEAREVAPADAFASSFHSVLALVMRLVEGTLFITRLTFRPKEACCALSAAGQATRMRRTCVAGTLEWTVLLGRPLPIGCTDADTVVIDDSSKDLTDGAEAMNAASRHLVRRVGTDREGVAHFVKAVLAAQWIALLAVVAIVK
jgi:hypothetical protein